jgi:hypothetical protein
VLATELPRGLVVALEPELGLEKPAFAAPPPA